MDKNITSFNEAVGRANSQGYWTQARIESWDPSLEYLPSLMQNVNYYIGRPLDKDVVDHLLYYKIDTNKN